MARGLVIILIGVCIVGWLIFGGRAADLAAAIGGGQ